MKEILFVGIGGFLGSIARYKLSGYFLHTFSAHKFPWGTFVVNIIGCFLIGLLGGLIEKEHFFSPNLRVLLISGILGGFTTFSAFGLETIYLFKRGEVLIAVFNVIFSVVVGLFLTWLGFRLIES
jgi:fluoride exporter